MLDKIAAWIQGFTGLVPATQHKIIVSITAVIILWLLRFFVKRLIWDNTQKIETRYRWRKMIGYIYVLLIFVVLFRIWFNPNWNIVNILALVAAAVIIALQELIRSIAGWFTLIWMRPFQVGDRIQIDNGITGDVIDIRLFKFTLNEVGNWVHADQSTGRVMHVPNSVVLDKTVINFTETFPYIWIELPILVTFESDWQAAKAILQEIADKHSHKISDSAQLKIKDASKHYMLYYKKLTPIVYTSVESCGVLLTMRLLAEPHQRRACEHAIWEDVLVEFAQHKTIDFAYPTRRFYNSLTEGKK
ncbi:MAG: mechanosensitive ion channel family protein [Victivallaceae bacterium]|nr:mechanosensitive ion channel family protein [Victivallaceae bacterium]